MSDKPPCADKESRKGSGDREDGATERRGRAIRHQKDCGRDPEICEYPECKQPPASGKWLCEPACGDSHTRADHENRKSFAGSGRRRIRADQFVERGESEDDRHHSEQGSEDRNDCSAGSLVLYPLVVVWFVEPFVKCLPRTVPFGGDDRARHAVYFALNLGKEKICVRPVPPVRFFRGRGSLIESSAYSMLVSSLLRTAVCVVRGGRERYDFGVQDLFMH